MNKPLLEVYVKRDFLLENVRPVPLLMHISPNDTLHELEYWNLLRRQLKDSIKVELFTHLNEAGEFIIVPFSLNHYRSLGKLSEVISFSQLAKKSGKKVIAFQEGSLQINPKYFSFLFKTNIHLDDTNSYSYPNWLYDLGMDNHFPVHDIPSLGFVGNTEYPGKLNSIFKHIPLPFFIVRKLACSNFVDQSLTDLKKKQVLARYIRQSLLKSLNGFSKIYTNVYARNRGFFNLSPEEKVINRQEYEDCIRNNLYFVAIRGDGVGFFQLLEIISAGRIPVLIDNGVKLPKLLNHQWEDFTLQVPFEEIPYLEEHILSFHYRYTKSELIEKCKLARSAYEELLPHYFVPNIIVPEITICLSSVGFKSRSDNAEKNKGSLYRRLES